MAADSVAYSTVNESIKMLSAAIAAAMAVGLLITVPSCSVIDRSTPPGPGVMAVT
ncbi:hypothetical protein D3C78_1834770 [compost metagenome]